MTLASLYSHQRCRCLLALFGGALGTLAYAPFGLWPVALVSLLALLILSLDRTNRQSAAVGFCWGLGLFGSGVNWVYVSIQQFGGLPVPFSVGLVLLLAGYLSLYTMLFSFLLNRFWPQTSFTKLVIVAPSLWTFTEFLRGWVMTGFPWLQFGYSQIDGPLKGIAPIFGVDAISFMLMMVAGLITYSIFTKNIRYVVIAALVVVAATPLKSMRWYIEQSGRGVNIALVQGNIAQSLKWTPDQLQPTIDKYLNASRPFFGKAQIIIWPEVAIPDLEGNQVDFLKIMDGILRSQHTTLLTGIIDRRASLEGLKIYNALIAVGSKTPYSLQDTNRYHKRHLVIFGEFVPFETILRPLAGFFDLPMSSMTRGDARQPQLKADGYNFTSAICYEVILGRLVRENFKPDTDFLLTVSNDAWFGHSIGPWQHFEMARMRALELGRPLLRSTNTGVTAVINADGDVIKALPQFETGVLDVTITPTTGITPYAHWGSWPLWILCALMLISSLTWRFTQSK
jgi:apolipoprotein N-acyltransferase